MSGFSLWWQGWNPEVGKPGGLVAESSELTWPPNPKETGEGVPARELEFTFRNVGDQPVTVRSVTSL